MSTPTKLNCWPGCIARVINDPETRAFGIVDRFVKVSQRHDFRDFPAWALEDGPIQVKAGWIVAIADCLLRPINNPWDDAVDETLRDSKPATHLGKDVKVTPVTVEAL